VNEEKPGRKLPARSRAKRFYFDADADPDDRMNRLDKLNYFLHTIALSTGFKVIVSKANDIRTEAQNDLNWTWCAEIASHHDDSYTGDYIHGWNKLYVLLPLLKHSEHFERWREEGEMLQGIINDQTSHDLKIRIAYDCIRTSGKGGLHVNEMRLFLEAVKKHWFERMNIRLTSQHPKYDLAMNSRQANQQ